MVRIFYASDVHGSEVCFRKFLNAGKVYGADALVLGGDLTGKIVVPILRHPDGTYEAHVFGQRHYGSNPEDLARLREEIAVSGAYTQLVDKQEIDGALRDPARQRELFRKAMCETLERWISLAEERLRETKTECYIMPGNDDDPMTSEIISRSSRIVNPDGKVVTVCGLYEMVSVGFSNRTPFDSPRELEEPQLQTLISALADKVTGMGNTIFNLHCPPYGSGLDMAPEVDKDLQIVSYGGQPRTIPVGSTAVRDAIQEFQPLLSLHGHVHESRGIARIGRTTCLNPGSAYGEGVLHGVVVDLEGDRLRNYQFVAG